MNHNNLFICASYFLFTNYLLMVEGFFGFNWGRIATQRMIPSMVVDMLMQNGISDVKLYSTSENVLAPFGGTNISVSVTFTNPQLKFMITDDDANKWINNYVLKYQKMNVNFRYVKNILNIYITFLRVFLTG